MIEPVFEKIFISDKSENISDQIKCECKTDVLAENVKALLSAVPFVTLKDSEKDNGNIKYNGKITFYISYVTTDGAIKKCECGSEFSGEIKSSLSDNDKIFVTCIPEKAESFLDGAYLTTKAIVSINAEITHNIEVDALSGGKNLIVKEEELSLYKGLGLCQSMYPVEEEFSLSYTVEDVLYHRAQGIIKGVQCGVGCIIVDGEVLLNVIMLQNNDKKDIIKEEKIIPFRTEIECEQAMPTMIATCHLTEKSFKTDITVDSDSGKSTVKVSTTLQFFAEAFLTENVSVASDAFSIDDEIEMERENYSAVINYELRNYSDKIILKTETNQLPQGAVISAVCSDRALITDKHISDGKVSVTGVFYGLCFIKDEENNTFTRKVEAPFQLSFDDDYEEGTLLDFTIKTAKANGRILSDNQIELEAEVYLTCYPSKTSVSTFIKQVKATEEKKLSDTAISVVIPYRGEELWSLAKRLNVCPQELISTNKELNFPLSGKERIVIYRQK